MTSSPDVRYPPTPREMGHQGDDRLNGWGRPRQRQQHDVPQNPRESPLLPRQVDDHPNGWGSMLTSTNGHLHHVREWQDQATWGVVDNAWRGGLLDEEGKIRYGWGNVADTFMEDPRWTDYIETVKCGDNPSLTWKQYTAALEYKRHQPSSHQEQHWTQHLVRSQREQQSREPQSQTTRWREGATRAAPATSALPYGHTSKKALKLQEHKRKVALALGQQRTSEEAEVQRRIQRRRRRQEVEEHQAMAMRWKNNRGEAVASVPLLPPELWAHILRQGRLERAQLETWVAWANATLMKLVVVWFRTNGQRDKKWLGRLVANRGGIASADTANIATRFAPWCRAILQPGEENDPLHYTGTGGAPANFVNVYTHMLSMMKYLGFHNVIERLQLILCGCWVKKPANKCRWQRRRDRPRPSRPLRVRRWQAAIALLLALARSHDPPHSSSNRTFAPRCQPQGTPLTCCTDLLPHTPTPTNTPPGDGTSLNWMPFCAASACRPARDATQCSAVRRPHKNALKDHSMFTQSNQCNQSSIKHAQKRTQALPQASLPPLTIRQQ